MSRARASLEQLSVGLVLTAHPTEARRRTLLIALVVSPLWADFWDWIINDLFNVGIVTIGQVQYSFPGVRIALWGGGMITLGAGLYARWSMKNADRAEVEDSDIAGDAAA